MALAAAAGATVFAWQRGMWGCVVGGLLVTVWMLALLWWGRRALPAQRQIATIDEPGSDHMALRLLLDQLPTPLVSIKAEGAFAMNRSARSLFGTDDRIAPDPTALLSPKDTRFEYAGRHWRIDRVEAGTAADLRSILALIDIEAEERAGEARAVADMIQVMGHELLNGLAPIVSLAESGLAAWLQPEAQREQLMPDVLSTLARRAEGLQRFAEAYRRLARLPDPVKSPVSPRQLVDDLARLFEGRWRGQVTLRADTADDLLCFNADRDQLTQAAWALLQNAAEAAVASGERPWVALNLAVDNGRTEISVSDSGSGVRPEHRGRIFHPFHTTKIDGTGIGLSLARQIALAHGGDLQLAVGAPTTFVISLP